MTIDDFDMNEISDKLAVREEGEDALTLEACHDDTHYDAVPHCDTFTGTFHDDCAGYNHNDGHGDIAYFDDVSHDDCRDTGTCVF